MDVADIIARHLVTSKFEDIPADALDMTKQIIADNMAVALAGSTALGSRQAVEMMLDLGGKPESTVWVYGGKIPAMHAAFANSAMGHGVDFDDTHPASFCHTGSIVVPTAFAIAERKGKVGGRELLTAVNLGIDLMCRLGMAPAINELETGWHASTLYGYFGAAAVAGRILGFDKDTMVNALGMAYSQAAGNLQCITNGTMNKRLQPGFAVESGIQAAMLAERGVTGTTDCFEGAAGLYPLYHNNKYSREAITSGLGKRFETVNLSFKNHPSCAFTQAFADATLALVREHDIRPEEVESVMTYGGPRAALWPGMPEKKHIKNVIDAQFSVYYTAANAIVRRRSTPSEYTDGAVHDPVVLEMVSKVYFTEVPEFAGAIPGTQAEKARVEIKTGRQGQSFSKQIDIQKGWPGNPMTFEEHLEKAKGCLPLAARPIPEANLEKLIDMVSKLEQAEDVSAVIECLLPPSGRTRRGR